MKYFIDWCMGSSVAEGLRGAGHEIVWFHECFKDQRTPDDVWIPRVGANGLVIITEDLGIKRRDNEFDALYDTRVKCFMAGSANLASDARLRLLADVWEKIEQICETVEGPFLYRINLDRTVTRKDKPDDWDHVRKVRNLLSAPSS